MCDFEQTVFRLHVIFAVQTESSGDTFCLDRTNIKLNLYISQNAKRFLYKMIVQEYFTNY